MANYLVAGAKSFIGAKVSELLLADGHTVVGVGELDNSHHFHLEQIRLDALQVFDKFEFCEIDISDHKILSGWIKKRKQFDAIFNMTSVTEQINILKPQEFFGSNLMGTLNLLQACKETGIQKFIQASTAKVYGTNTVVLPIHETATINRLVSLDAVAQKAAEDIAYSFFAESNIEVTVFRYFNVYGPFDQPNSLIVTLCKSIYEEDTITILGDGTQRQGISYIDDVAKATIQGIESQGYQEYNLGGHELVSLNKLIAIIEKVLGKKAKIERISSDLSLATTQFPGLEKAKIVLGWTPEISLEEGIKSTVDWYIRERDWLKSVD